MLSPGALLQPDAQDEFLERLLVWVLAWLAQHYRGPGRPATCFWVFLRLDAAFITMTSEHTPNAGWALMQQAMAR